MPIQPLAPIYPGLGQALNIAGLHTRWLQKCHYRYHSEFSYLNNTRQSNEAQLGVAVSGRVYNPTHTDQPRQQYVAQQTPKH